MISNIYLDNIEKKKLFFPCSGCDSNGLLKSSPCKYPKKSKIKAVPYPLAVTSSPGKMEVIRVNYALPNMLYPIWKSETTA